MKFKIKKTKCPYYPCDDMDNNYIIESLEEKNIADYLNISIFDVEELDLIEFLFFLRESFIYKLSQTDEGREYLSNAYRLEQTSPDRENLRKNLKRQAV